MPSNPQALQSLVDRLSMASNAPTPCQIKTAQAVSGGDINQAFKLTLTDDRVVFFKTQDPSAGLPGLFEAEAQGLQAMANAAGPGLHVPSVLGVGDAGLMLSFCPFEALGPSGTADLGQALAHMHRNASQAENAAGRFGFQQTTYLARLALDNTWQDDWATFWWAQRLKPMFERLPNDDALKPLARDFEAGVPKWLGPDSPAFDEPPVLVHGDLWSGNAAVCDGKPSVFDPAAFYGHREFEFGMTRLFGFGQTFEDAYQSVWPLAEGWEDRVAMYRAYHLMNHWLHFGASYRKQTLDALHEVLAALG